VSLCVFFSAFQSPTSQAIAAAGVARQRTFIGGKLYSEATITAFANKFQQITLYQQQHPPMFTK
jgi:hypothetical protein